MTLLGEAFRSLLRRVIEPMVQDLGFKGRRPQDPDNGFQVPRYHILKGFC